MGIGPFLKNLGKLHLGKETKNVQGLGMAWRIDEQVIRGEIDNRVRGRLWLVGRKEPLELELAGDCWRDLAGRCLEFVNPGPKNRASDTLTTDQKGVVGDITASRKVKVPDASEADHPVSYLLECVAKAGEKIEGALDERDWPPEIDQCSGIIARLKRARVYLDDSLLALESCQEQKLIDLSSMGVAFVEIIDAAQDADKIMAELGARLKDGC